MTTILHKWLARYSCNNTTNLAMIKWGELVFFHILNTPVSKYLLWSWAMLDGKVVTAAPVLPVSRAETATESTQAFQGELLLQIGFRVESCLEPFLRIVVSFGPLNLITNSLELTTRSKTWWKNNIQQITYMKSTTCNNVHECWTMYIKSSLWCTFSNQTKRGKVQDPTGNWS